HAITDGRDTKPTEGVESIQKIQDYIEKIGLGRIVTLSGLGIATICNRMDTNISYCL
ncbi:MAG: hypothetical protein F6K09_29590, partial [Merismopedia sp. SIO2A8]|nr:hypothetical protein [Merismopedia sp. SIO2A8]